MFLRLARVDGADLDPDDIGETFQLGGLGGRGVVCLGGLGEEEGGEEVVRLVRVQGAGCAVLPDKGGRGEWSFHSMREVVWVCVVLEAGMVGSG